MGNSNKNTPVVKATGANPKGSAPAVVESPVANVEGSTPIAVETPVVNLEGSAPAVVESPVTNVEGSIPVVNTGNLNELKTNEALIIPSGRYIAENGDEFDFTVAKFTFQGKTYTKEEALSDHTDVLEHLASIKSFILKKL